MITGLQLPFRFDPLLLKTDLAALAPEAWIPHYNERDYGGDWHGVALRSLSGASHQLFAGQAGSEAYADTGALHRSPYFQKVLSVFECPLKSVRLLRLGSGSVIREHTDPALGFEDGEVRIHIPIQTNPGVEFHLAGERLHFEEGGCYYLNVSLPHRVSNSGAEDRIHLVIDADVNDWIRSVFSRSEAMPTSLAADESPGLGWIPVSLDVESGKPVAEWVSFGSRRFTEPFFDDSVRAALRNPSVRAFRHKAPLAESPGMTPSGFIFHMSRCGSTLISRTLASLSRTLVISEAAPIDDAIRTNNVEWFRWMVQALGRRRADETHYFIKLDAWHIRNLPLIRAAFPLTPWVFVFRDPLEVLVSQSESPGKLALPGAMDPQSLGRSIEEITTLGREEWCARVLAGFCQSALDGRNDPKSLFLNYRQLPDVMWGSLAEHFSLALTSDELTRMQDAAKFDAKSPSRAFEPDTRRKQSAASAAIGGLAAKWLNPLHNELEKLTLHA
jgi:hypothetical protein